MKLAFPDDDIKEELDRAADELLDEVLDGIIEGPVVSRMILDRFKEHTGTRLGVAVNEMDTDKADRAAKDAYDVQVFHSFKKRNQYRIWVEGENGIWRKLPSLVNTEKGEVRLQRILDGVLQGDTRYIELLQDVHSAYFDTETEYRDVRKTVEYFSEAAKAGTAYKDDEGKYHSGSPRNTRFLN